MLKSYIKKWKIDTILFYIIMPIAIWWGVGKWQTRDLLPNDGKIKAPSFSLMGIDGNNYTFKGDSGKRTLFYFFAPWCSACQFTSSNVEEMREIHGEKLDVYAIALAYESKKSVEDFAKEKGLKIPVLLGNDDIHLSYKISAFPTFYFLNEDGYIINSTVGYTTRLGLEVRY